MTTNKKQQFWIIYLFLISSTVRHKLDLVGVQEVRWEKEGTVKAGDYSFFYGKGNENHQLGTGFFFTLQNSFSS